MMDIRWSEGDQSRMILHSCPQQLITWSCIYRVRKALEGERLCVGRRRKEMEGSALGKLGLRTYFTFSEDVN